MKTQPTFSILQSVQRLNGQTTPYIIFAMKWRRETKFQYAHWEYFVSADGIDTYGTWVPEHLLCAAAQPAPVAAG
jgi:hypothetical protein